MKIFIFCTRFVNIVNIYLQEKALSGGPSQGGDQVKSSTPLLDLQYGNPKKDEEGESSRESTAKSRISNLSDRMFPTGGFLYSARSEASTGSAVSNGSTGSEQEQASTEEFDYIKALSKAHDIRYY